MTTKLQGSLLLAVALFPSPQANAFNPQAGELAKEDPAHIRVLSYNVYNLFPAGNATQTSAHERILRAIQPDIISYQEMDPGIGIALRIRLQQILGPPWYIHEGQALGSNVNMIASRFPLSMQRVDTEPASGPRGVTMALIDLPNDLYQSDVYLMGVHFQCCTGSAQDISRQRHADAIASWIGRAKQPGGIVQLAPGTAIMVVGDVNFNSVAAPGPRRTLMEGTIQDTSTFGPSVRLDWDDSDMAEALPLNPFTSSPNTFSSETASPTVRLDRFYFTDSIATVAGGFILNTLTIPGPQLTALGLQANDTRIASDHLPVVVDFIIGNRIEPGLEPSGWLLR